MLRRPCSELSQQNARRLVERLDVHCLRALVALGQLKADPGTLRQTAVSLGFDFALVDENVLAVIRLDESKTLGIVEPLHFSFCHA